MRWSEKKCIWRKSVVPSSWCLDSTHGFVTVIRCELWWCPLLSSLNCFHLILSFEYVWLVILCFQYFLSKGAQKWVCKITSKFGKCFGCMHNISSAYVHIYAWYIKSNKNILRKINHDFFLPYNFHNYDLYGKKQKKKKPHERTLKNGNDYNLLYMHQPSKLKCKQNCVRQPNTSGVFNK